MARNWFEIREAAAQARRVRRERRGRLARWWRAVTGWVAGLGPESREP